MHLKDIPRVPVRRHMPADVQRLQKNAPLYVKSIIERTQAFPQIRSIEELPSGSIELLEGGMASALYSLNTDNAFAVLKLRNDGIEAEHEALLAWAAKGVRVPNIRKKGVVPHTRRANPVKYLLLDFVVDKKGEQAPTGTAYLAKNPRRARRMGQLMGRTLARMHRAKSDRTFGEFADLSGSNRSPLRSWNQYLLGYVRLHRRYLMGLGISRRAIDALAGAIKRMRFPSRGTYVHGDYSLRNIMIVSSLRLKAVVFDPNPIIGDPSWDIAVLFNNRDFRRRKHEWEPGNREYRREYVKEQRLLDGFWQSYRRAHAETVDLEKIRVSQLIHTLMSLRTEEQKYYRKKKDKELEIRVRREALFERFGSLAPTITEGDL